MTLSLKEVAILNWNSRSIVSWEPDQTMQSAFVLEAMQRALERVTPQCVIAIKAVSFNPQYTQLLLSHNVRIHQSLGYRTPAEGYFAR